MHENKFHNRGFFATSSSFFYGENRIFRLQHNIFIGQSPSMWPPFLPCFAHGTKYGIFFPSLPRMERERGNDAFSSLFFGTTLPYLGELAEKNLWLGLFRTFSRSGPSSLKLLWQYRKRMPKESIVRDTDHYFRDKKRETPSRCRPKINLAFFPATHHILPARRWWGYKKMGNKGPLWLMRRGSGRAPYQNKFFALRRHFFCLASLA